MLAGVALAYLHGGRESTAGGKRRASAWLAKGMLLGGMRVDDGRWLFTSEEGMQIY